MTYAPVIIFIYNRADHFRKTFDALSVCPEARDTELYIFADGAKDESGREKVDACRRAAREAAEDSVFKNVTITEAPENKGLAASIISGVTAVMEKHDRAVVLEDDCVASPYFLKFMNSALDKFAEDKRVGQIAGYAPAIVFPEGFTDDVFTCYRSCSCSWATWADRWQGVDWDMAEASAFFRDRGCVRRMNADGTDRFLRYYRQTKGGGTSWSVRFGAHLIKNGMLTVYPRYSYIRNIGCDESGVHSRSEDAESMSVDLSKAKESPVIGFSEPDREIRARLRKHYSGGVISEIKRFAGMLYVLVAERLK